MFVNMNTKNYGVAIGRLVRPPKCYENKDGSHKLLYTLAVNRNYLGKDGKRGADFLNLETYLPPKTPVEQTVYSKLCPGELVAVRYTIHTSSYTDATGERKYTFCLLTQEIELLETRSAKQAAQDREGGEEAPFPDDDEMPF